MGISLDQRKKIKQKYEKYLPDIMRGPISPYLIADWINLLTPIEINTWDAIRYLGIPMYPQFPIGRYYVDFADPISKFVLEIDSIAWHKDSEKDRKRQLDIESLGWKVARIPSKYTYKEDEDFKDEEGNIDEERYKTECIEGWLYDAYIKSGRLERMQEKWIDSGVKHISEFSREYFEILKNRMEKA